MITKVYKYLRLSECESLRIRNPNAKMLIYKRFYSYKIYSVIGRIPEIMRLGKNSITLINATIMV